MFDWNPESRCLICSALYYDQMLQAVTKKMWKYPILWDQRSLTESLGNPYELFDKGGFSHLELSWCFQQRRVEFNVTLQIISNNCTSESTRKIICRIFRQEELLFDSVTQMWSYYNGNSLIIRRSNQVGAEWRIVRLARVYSGDGDVLPELEIAVYLQKSSTYRSGINGIHNLGQRCYWSRSNYTK